MDGWREETDGYAGPVLTGHEKREGLLSNNKESSEKRRYIALSTSKRDKYVQSVLCCSALCLHVVLASHSPPTSHHHRRGSKQASSPSLPTSPALYKQTKHFRVQQSPSKPPFIGIRPVPTSPFSPFPPLILDQVLWGTKALTSLFASKQDFPSSWHKASF